MAGREEAIDPEKVEEYLAWAIDQRAEIQHTLLALYDFVRLNAPQHLNLNTRYLLDQLIGAAFSLWRAVFLAETIRDDIRVHESREAFLLKVISDNAISFADDKLNRHWTVEYYLENAKIRLSHTVSYVDHKKGLKLTEQLIPLLALRGVHGAELTRYEWECAHHVCRVLLRILVPSTDLVAKQPQLPKPKGLDAFLKG